MSVWLWLLCLEATASPRERIFMSLGSIKSLSHKCYGYGIFFLIRVCFVEMTFLVLSCTYVVVEIFVVPTVRKVILNAFSSGRTNGSRSSPINQWPAYLVLNSLENLRACCIRKHYLYFKLFDLMER